MIYRVVLDDLYDLHTSDIDCMLLNPSIELEMNAAGSFNFTLPPTHPYWDSIEILKSTIDVYEDDDLIFTGRVANIDKNWNNERVIECEGALAYFNDSIHRQMKWETPLPIASEDPEVHNFLKDILDNHNAFVGNAVNRQIHIGHIYVDPYLVTREVNYDKTLDILTRMCIDTNGGYFMIRKDPESHLLYLDWLKDFTEESGQPASFGVNLLDFNTGLHAEDICTGVLARGATVNDQVVTLSNVELVDKDTYPDMSVDHYTDQYQDILWHREGVEKFGQVVQVHDFPDAQTDWKHDGQVVANSLFEEARKWLEEKNTKVESIEVEVAELSWLQEGVPKYKLGQIVEILDDAHMSGESYDVRRLPMYKLSCDLSSGSKKVTLGRPPKKELTQISASNSDSNTLSSGNSSGSSSGGGSGSGEECKVHDVRVDGTSVVNDKIANISLTGKADTSTVNALAATVATKADASTVTALANVVSGKQDQIEFNTQEAATEVLTRLKADDKVYNLGGGTSVEANPVEAATDDLETIKIGNTVYDIPGGGSSTNYGKFKCDVLFVNDPMPSATSGTSTVTRTYTLNKSIDDYDAIYVMTANYHHTEGDEYFNSQLILKQDYYKRATISGEEDYAYMTAPGLGNTFLILDFVIVDDTHIKTIGVRNYSNTEPILYKVYGLKFENKLINRSDIYSEEERMIGRWTDGKPLYQKTWNGLGLTIPQTYWQQTSISMSDMDYWQVISNKNDGTNYDNQYSMLYRKINNLLQVFCPYEIPLDSLTIQYTKTTDTPGSGFLPEDPQMVMMSDYYSEEEQVVGRWTDGKPLYQKTITNNSGVSSLNTWTEVIDVGQTCNIISFDAYILTSVGEIHLGYDGQGSNANYIMNMNSSIVKTLGKVSAYFENSAQWLLNTPIRATVQYTKSTDTPGTGPTPGNLIYLPALYSEEEREVGVWTDGKPLYQKTWMGLNINVTNDWTSTGITISDADNIILATGTRSNTECSVCLNAIIQSGGVIKISKDTTGFTGVNSLTLQYTKTTDQPGSGKYLPDGQLAHNYSTSEKVVGTWIDGSTLYEKTINFGSLPNNTTKTVSSGLSNISVQQIFGVAKASNGFTVTLPHREISGSGNIDIVYQADNYIRIVTDYNYSGYTAYVTLQYTKSS